MSEDQRARDQARAQFKSIKEMLEALDEARNTGDDEAFENAQTNIHEDPLAIQVRGGWCDLGAKSEPEEFYILLCTGGPAVRIIGDLDEHLQPSAAKLQYQDWFTPWEDYYPDHEHRDEILLDYCQQFYFGG